jgi:ABC-type glycerol-3-phosphate transport system permease component
MKTWHKRFIAAFVTLVAGVFVQWCSGYAFQRSPGEAFIVGWILFFALMAASFPGWDE